MLEQRSYLFTTAIFSAIVLINTLSLIITSYGSSTNWYLNLKKPLLAPYMTTLWILATVTSYITLFISANKEKLHNLTLIGAFLELSWVILFYYKQDIGLSLWTVGVLFIYKFFVFMYVWLACPLAAVFLIPILTFNVYHIYYIAQLAYYNNVKL